MRRTRSNFPNEVVDTRLGYRLASRVEPVREARIVTARSPSVHRRTTSLAPVEAAQLESIPLFAGLTLDQRETVAEACAQMTVEAGTTLVREGDFGHAAFAIMDGSAAVVHDGEVLRTLGPGDMFGEIAVLASGRRTATVVATTDMTLITVLNRELWRIERDCPAIADAPRATIAERLEASSG